MDSNNETLNTSSVKLRKSGPDIQLILPTGSRSSTPINLASRHNSTPDNLTPDNLTPNNLSPADNLNLTQNVRPHTVQLGQFDNLSFHPIQIQTNPFNPESLNIGNFNPGPFNPGNFIPGPSNPGNFNPGLWNQGHFNPNNSSIDLSTLECSIQDGATTTIRLGNFNRNPEQLNETAEYNFGRFHPGFNPGQINYGQFNARPYDHRCGNTG